MIKIEVCYNVIPRLDRGIQKTNTSKLKEFQYILKSSLTNKKWDNVLQNDELKEVFVDLKANKRGSKRIAIVYPNSYYVGMSNLGFQGLFYKFSSQDNFNVNRFFYDATSAKKVFSPENHFSLKQADIILISISFETDFIFFIEILLANGIETNVLKREAPFIGIGGVFPSLNPIFFINIVNIVFCGEFECYINELFMFCSSLESSKKINMLDLYSNIENIFNKFSCYKENGIIIESKTLFNPLSIPNYTHILTPKTSFSNSFLIELTRGCKFKCNFCTVPSIFGKLRHFSKENIIMALDLGLAKTKKVGFISALTTEHPDLKELIYYVNANGGEISFSSMRIEQIDNELLNLIRKNKQNILTIAPEVASEKLKKKLHKSIKNEKILDLFERALQTKFKKFKFYFIIGFAEEDHDDLNGIINLMKRIKQIALTYARVNKYMPELILSINQFIPKPKTPLHVETFVNYKLVKDRFNYLKKNILSLGNITINHDNYKENYIQWRFSHGNENLSADVIEWIKKNNNVKSIYQFLSKELI